MPPACKLLIRIINFKTIIHAYCAKVISYVMMGTEPITPVGGVTCDIGNDLIAKVKMSISQDVNSWLLTYIWWHIQIGRRFSGLH